MAVACRALIGIGLLGVCLLALLWFPVMCVPTVYKVGTSNKCLSSNQYLIFFMSVEFLTANEHCSHSKRHKLLLGCFQSVFLVVWHIMMAFGLKKPDIYFFV